MALGVSPVLIGNMALSHIGANSTIESLTENSAGAKQVNIWYQYARRQSLAAFDWNFARKRLLLALHSEAAPSGDWSFRYQYPADCLVARAIVNPSGWTNDAVPFQVETNSTGDVRTILTNMEEATLAYTFDQQDTTLFSEFFVELLSYNLAAKIAQPITGKVQLKQLMMQTYQQMLAVAPAQNANEGVQRGPRDAEWIRARGSGYADRDTVFNTQSFVEYSGS